VIDEAYADDPQGAAAEYGAQFRSDISALFDPELVEGLARSNPPEIPRVDGPKYRAFVDPSGGSSDEMTLAIAHKSKAGTAVVNLIKAVPAPFNPKSVVADFANTLKAYGLRECTGDRYGAEWVKSEFEAVGITYKTSDLTKSEIYLEAVSPFNQGKVELPPDRRMLTQLAQLERRTSRSGKDSVDHPPGGKDDRANATCGAIWLATADKGLSPEQQAGLAKGLADCLRDGAKESFMDNGRGNATRSSETHPMFGSRHQPTNRWKI
jgi:hypothetical protein